MLKLFGEFLAFTIGKEKLAKRSVADISVSKISVQKTLNSATQVKIFNRHGYHFVLDFFL